MKFYRCIIVLRTAERSCSGRPEPPQIEYISINISTAIPKSGARWHSLNVGKRADIPSALFLCFCFEMPVSFYYMCSARERGVRSGGGITSVLQFTP